MTDKHAGIEDLIRKQVGCNDLPPSDADLLDALRIDGDDVVDVISAFAMRFDVDLSGYRFYYHHSPEGFDLLTFVDMGFFSSAAFEGRRIPITIALLEQAAMLGRWPVDYPNLAATEAEYRRWSRWQTAIGLGCPLAVIAVFAILAP